LDTAVDTALDTGNRDSFSPGLFDSAAGLDSGGPLDTNPNVDTGSGLDSGFGFDSGDTDTDTGYYSSTLVDESLQNTCAESLLAPAMTTPGYYTHSWSTSGFTPTIEPDYDYYAFSGWQNLEAPGIDGMIRIELEYGESLWAGYQLPSSDAAIYLLEDCGDDTSGVAGDDYWHTTPEQMAYTYWGTTPKVFFLVLDDWENSSTLNSSFDLELQIGGELVDLSLQDNCADSATAPVLTTPGTHRYTWSSWGFTDVRNPSCGVDGPGVDGMIRIELEYGERVTVDRYQLVQGDAVVYLLEDCDDPYSCLVGSDSYSSSPETMYYDYWGTNPKVFTLVLDDWNGGGGWFLPPPPSDPRSFELKLTID
jgi:hypothetical protein